MTKRPDFEIADVGIAAGTRQTVHIPVSTLSDHTPVTLSAHVIHGSRDGPVTFVSAGIHGDEVIGVEIVRRLLRAKALKSLRGTLIVVPIVNTFGFLSHSRYLPDRRDLNRCFPGSPNGSLGSRLAHIFLTEIVTRCSLGIDLHSAAINRINLPQIRVSANNANTMKLAHVFGAPVILTSALRDGSLRQEAKKMGVDVLLYEAGEGMRFDEMSVRAGLAGCLRVLKEIGMLPRAGIAKPKAQPLLCANSSWLRAPAGGLLRMYKSEGDVIHEGDTVAAISDPFGDGEIDVLARNGGIIVGRAVMPIVHEGDALFHVAAVKSADVAEAAVDDLALQLEEAPLFDEDEII
ncbi:succinylglutamate desuccinylase/aspartoacylase family protein [Marivita sp. S6314]|uniref:succinylglutamate desuccinylase/aspartoacylase family protein n=1 Tax=Marivita sp. S6314 TaxID=2926406 RepID=UPI001FF51033|nr:succinylglutamate desuccinylase/aspartoacylase family protein [Marivita sp. S6314]MCK0151162.1 succinylglutamate desuccinylase/aspartoacylase family protein [Marivita sp. S6314]